MKLSQDKLKDILVGPGHILQDDFDKAAKEAQKRKDDLDEFLVEKGLIKDEQLGRAIADSIGLKFLDLKKVKIDEEVMRVIPEAVARARGIVGISRNAEGMRVGMTDPGDLEAVHFVEKRTGEKILPYFITRRSLEHALGLYKAGLGEEFKKILTRLAGKSLTREQRDEATVKMVDLLLSYGYENKSSDIHIEPYKAKVLVRFRIDGVMHDVLEVPKELLDFLVTRIKILSKLRTDEHRAAQDGRFRFSAQEEPVDVRVSVMPVTEGENVVMRLLSSRSRQFGLEDLGISAGDLGKLKKAMKNPHGMILATGPTGSGKTTTLYGILKIFNKREVHIATIEDPVEYDIEGVSQIQVNTRTNLTFAKGLRSIVRQDPDIIMVGEIRDSETAGIAVNAAMTGHLVLSTLHANDAATTLPRLLDMGIEPFLVSSTVRIAIAQRLVRRICQVCRASSSLSEDEIRAIENNPYVREAFIRIGKNDLEKITVYRGAGCKVCAKTGYSGRVGIFEILEMQENIKDLVTKHASSDEVVKAARGNGMTTMMEDGIGKVLQGVTTLEEVLRVTRE